MKKLSEKQLEKKLEDVVTESLSKEIRYSLAPVKEHIVIYMWETFVKHHLYHMHCMGYSEKEAVNTLLESDESLLWFCDFCTGYAEGMRGED